MRISQDSDITRTAAVDDAITSRRSIRAFLPDPVPRETIEQILAVASRAPSGTNTQPWTVHAVTGERLESLSDDLVAAHNDPNRKDEREYQYYPTEWFEPILSRRRKVGWDLYGLLGIKKGDKVAMHAQLGENYRLFGAPVGLFFSIDRRLEKGSWLDYGMFLENIMIAARGRGLDTCPQAALVNYPAEVRRHLGVDESQVLVCGMALGYADQSAHINTLETEREPHSGFATFVGW